VLSARHSWAVHLLDPGPAERVLEAGCGPGVAAGLVCDRLTTGSLLAVDRSPAAIARTSARNAAHLAAGRLTTRQAPVAELDLSGFDAAFAVDVNVFWTTPTAPDLAVLARALRPGGRLLILYGANGPTAGDRITTPIARGMTAAGLTAIRVVSDDDGFGVTGRAIS
jgi:SAM-dependent methyltransferase